MALERQIDVWVDGSIRREPGPSPDGRSGHAGAAFVFKMEHGDSRGAWVPYTWTGKEYALGIQDDNEVVELIAVLRALTYVCNRVGRTGGMLGDHIVVHCDCGNALEAVISGDTDHPRLGVYVKDILDWVEWFINARRDCSVTFQWVRRASTLGNRKADAMATSAARASELGGAGFAWNTGSPDEYLRYC